MKTQGAVEPIPTPEDLLPFGVSWSWGGSKDEPVNSKCDRCHNHPAAYIVRIGHGAGVYCHSCWQSGEGQQAARDIAEHIGDLCLSGDERRTLLARHATTARTFGFSV